MPKDRASLLVTLEIMAIGSLVGILLGVTAYVLYVSLSARQTSRSPALAASTQALNLAALPTKALTPTPAVPTLPPEWTVTPSPTRAAPTNTSAPPSPLPSATPSAAEAGSPTNALATSLLTPSASPAGGASSTATPTPTDAPPPVSTPVPGGAIGQRLEAGGLALTVMAVSKEEDSGFVHLVVDVVLENVGWEQDTYYGYDYFSIMDSEGLFYDAFGVAPEPGLREGDLALGSQVRGNVAFQIEPEARGLTLVFTPWLLREGYELILVNLGL